MPLDSMNLPDIPGRVFLDTSALNFVLEHGESIFDRVPVDDHATLRVKNDIEAFSNIFQTGQRANWQLAISPFTYREVLNTTDFSHRAHLQSWFHDVWAYWLGIIEEDDDLPTFIEAENTKISLITSGVLDVLPDSEDRFLICDAIAYRCDCFCTRDWKTILKHRDSLTDIPLKILSPTEWWKTIALYASLWV